MNNSSAFALWGIVGCLVSIAWRLDDVSRNVGQNQVRVVTLTNTVTVVKDDWNFDRYPHKPVICSSNSPTGPKHFVIFETKNGDIVKEVEQQKFGIEAIQPFNHGETFTNTCIELIGQDGKKIKVDLRKLRGL